MDLNFSVFILIFLSFTSNAQDLETFIFPATVLQQKSQRSFDLSSVLNSNDSVIELSRAVEAFSLEYFQVICMSVSQ